MQNVIGVNTVKLFDDEGNLVIETPSSIWPGGSGLFVGVHMNPRPCYHDGSSNFADCFAEYEIRFASVREVKKFLRRFNKDRQTGDLLAFAKVSGCEIVLVRPWDESR
jgi:hypothetical protein